jgi:ADP-dependent NAD(P)H-hydrate dehydratase
VRKSALHLSLALPESLVITLPTTKGGEIGIGGTGARLQPHVEQASAVLIGPGMLDGGSVCSMLQFLMPHVAPHTTLLLDGSAVVALSEEPSLLQPLAGRAVLTPHAGEMAGLMQMTEEAVLAAPEETAQRCAPEFGAVVVLKGGVTFIAQPNEPGVAYRDGKVGLATSGSGVVLAGVIAGLAARGTTPFAAAAWGVWAHGSAGNKVSRRIGRVGFLARELLPEIPSLLNS